MATRKSQRVGAGRAPQAPRKTAKSPHSTRSRSGGSRTPSEGGQPPQRSRAAPRGRGDTQAGGQATRGRADTGKGKSTARPPKPRSSKGSTTLQEKAHPGKKGTKRKGGSRRRGASPGVLKDIAAALAKITERIDTAADSSSEEDEPETPGHGDSSPDDQGETRESSRSPSPEQTASHAQRKKRRTSHKPRKGRRRDRDSSSDSSTGESSSSEDEVGDDGGYWLEAAKTPALPRWASRRRVVAAKRQRETKGGRAQTEGTPGPYIDNEDPPGNHLNRKIRRSILRGFYVDVFKLLKPRGEDAITSDRRRDSRREKGRTPERTFDNWLEGYGVFMAVVQAAFPDRGWHVTNHYLNVLQARRLAGDVAALAYDESFRRRASQSALTRWDLKNTDHWLVEVGLSQGARREGPRPLRTGRTAGRRVCWEYNAGKCTRAKCRFDHDCDTCFGPHPRVACTKLRAGQQPFRSSRPPSKPNIQRDIQGGPTTPPQGGAARK